MGCLFILIVLVLVGAYFASKTGLVSFFGKDTIEVPTPVHVVDVSDTTFEDVQAGLVASAMRSLKDGQMSVVITEEMLTTMLRDGLQKVESEALDIDESQVAIVDEYMEMYMPLTTAKKRTALRVRVRPTLESEDLKIKMDSIMLGELRLPTFVSTRYPQEAVNDALDSQLDAVQGTLELTGVELEEGQVILRGSLNAENFKLFR